MKLTPETYMEWHKEQHEHAADCSKAWAAGYRAALEAAATACDKLYIGYYKERFDVAQECAQIVRALKVPE